MLIIVFLFFLITTTWVAHEGVKVYDISAPIEDLNSARTTTRAASALIVVAAAPVLLYGFDNLFFCLVYLLGYIIATTACAADGLDYGLLDSLNIDIDVNVAAAFLWNQTDRTGISPYIINVTICAHICVVVFCSLLFRTSVRNILFR